MRLFLAAAVIALAVTPSPAAEFEENGDGAIEFTMPSGNVGCVYSPAGGTPVYQPVDGGPELSCDRVESDYVRVILGPKGKAKRHDDVGDASCCGSVNVFDYGEVWKEGGFTCVSATTGLTCTRGAHGFTMNRKVVKVY